MIVPYSGNDKGGRADENPSFSISFLIWFTALLAVAKPVLAKSYIAYISDSTSSSVIYWLAKEAGIFKNTGWIWIRSLSTAAFAAFKV